jgi:hypothetical protein
MSEVPMTEQELFNIVRDLGAKVETRLGVQDLRDHVACVSHAVQAIEARTAAGAELGARVREVMTRVIERELNAIEATLS